MFGNRGIMFIIFAFSVVINTLLSLNMHVMAISPDEYGVAGAAAYMSGLDWSGTMAPMGYYYGFAQSAAYAPFFLLFDNPYALYKALLVINGIAVSIIPVIAFDLSRRIGVRLVWQKLTISVCCGFYAAYIAHSKFIWNETAASVLPWLIIWLLFITGDTKKPVAKSLLSFLTAFLTALLYAAHPRLIGMVIAVVLTVLISMAITKKKLVLPLSFFTGLAVSGIVIYSLEFIIRQNVWLGTVRNNTIEGSLSRLDGLFTQQGFSDFISSLFGHLYYFVSSSWGLGALAMAVFAVMLFRNIYSGIKKKEKPYSPELVIFGVYAFFSVASMFGISVLFKFNSIMLNGTKDAVMFGRYMDCVIPLAVMFALCWLFIHEFSVAQVFAGFTIALSIDAGFFITAYPIIANADAYRLSPILSILPARFGENFTDPPDFASFVIIASSVSIAVIAALIVVSCGKHYKKQIISAVFAALFAYSSIYTAVTYLPLRAEESLIEAAPSIALSDFIYNDASSPVVITYRLKTKSYTLIQFLNPKTTVRAVTQKAAIPENCILIASKDNIFGFEDELIQIGEYQNIAVYARGEKAAAYVISKTLPQE